MADPRGWLNRHPAVSLAGALALMLAVVAVFLWPRFRPRIGQGFAHPRVYFYDPTTRRLFEGQAADPPPIDAPSHAKDAQGQPVGVRAYVWSCGSCDDEASRYVGYLETLTPSESAAAPAAAPGQRAPYGESGRGERARRDRRRMVASEDHPSRWFPATSREGLAIVEAAARGCGDGRPAVECFPSTKP